MKKKKRKLHGKLENFIKFNVYLNYTHLTVARLTGLSLSGQLVYFNYIMMLCNVHVKTTHLVPAWYRDRLDISPSVNVSSQEFALLSDSVFSGLASAGSTAICDKWT